MNCAEGLTPSDKEGEKTRMTPEEIEVIQLKINSDYYFTVPVSEIRHDIKLIVSEMERLRAENERLVKGIRALVKPPEPICYATSKDGKKMFCLQGEKITEINLEEIENEQSTNPFQ